MEAAQNPLRLWWKVQITGPPPEYSDLTSIPWDSATVGQQKNLGKAQNSSEGTALSDSRVWLLCPFYRREHWGPKSQSQEGAKLTHEPKSVRIPESTLGFTVGQSLQVQWVTESQLTSSAVASNSFPHVSFPQLSANICSWNGITRVVHQKPCF